MRQFVNSQDNFLKAQSEPIAEKWCNIYEETLSKVPIYWL